LTARRLGQLGESGVGGSVFGVGGSLGVWGGALPPRGLLGGLAFSGFWGVPRVPPCSPLSPGSFWFWGLSSRAFLPGGLSGLSEKGLKDKGRRGVRLLASPEKFGRALLGGGFPSRNPRDGYYRQERHMIIYEGTPTGARRRGAGRPSGRLCCATGLRAKRENKVHAAGVVLAATGMSRSRVCQTGKGQTQNLPKSFGAPQG